MKNLKVMTILGTRPELIRLSRVIALLEKSCNHRLVHTGQNWDKNLSDVFLSELDLPEPHHYLNCGGGSLGETLGKILARSEEVMLSEKPDAVLVLGDTNSALSTIMARRLKIPVYHMEAGNRCFDKNVPEELNRKIVDHVADFNLVYTEHGRRNLLAEGLPARRIYLTGSPMQEVLSYYKPRILQSRILESLELQPKKYVLASLHREENVDDSIRLKGILVGLERISCQLQVPVILSTHPRTRKRLEANQIGEVRGVVFSEPMGFFDYNQLQINAACVLSDSGTIAEEASILGFMGVSPRLSIERPEALDTAGVVTCNIDPEGMVNAVNYAVTCSRNDDFECRDRLPDDYRIMNTSQRVVNLIMSTAKVSNIWDGIRC